MNLTGLAIWVSMSLVLGSLGASWDSWQLYAGLGLMWALEVDTKWALIVSMKAAYEELLKEEEKNERH